MTQGGAARRICIRLSGDRTRELTALHSWLSLEEWFAQAQAQHGLTVVYRERDGKEQAAGPEGPPMGGAVTEIVLVLATGVLTPIVEDLYQHAKTSVHTFAANLSSRQRPVEGEVTVEDGTDDGSPESPDPRDGEGGRTG